MGRYNRKTQPLRWCGIQVSDNLDTKDKKRYLEEVNRVIL